MRLVARMGMIVAVGAMPLRAALAAPQVQIELPLNRTAYQDNESIDLAVVRSDTAALPAGDLSLTMEGMAGTVPDGSKVSFDFPLGAVALQNGTAISTERLRLTGRLMRPGNYNVTVTCDGATATASISVNSHLRKSTYKVGMWGSQAKGADQLVEGEDGMGYNLMLGYQQFDPLNNFIRAGLDYMECCTMGGSHQMDMRQVDDWSDPYVVRGGTARVVQRAFMDRTRPNVLGVHFYDEPGLTWWKDPETNEMTPHDIPSQVRSYKSAFGEDAPDYSKVDPNDPSSVAAWKHWASWKLGFMDAAWQDGQFGVSDVRPDFLSVTQSQYGWKAFTDGYYFNVVKSLPVVSGHGGYDDFGLRFFTPGMFLAVARAHAGNNPNWYLPAWYNTTPDDMYRAEQYLSFSQGIQGVMTPPYIEPTHPEKLIQADAIVETNKTMGRLGTIFTTMNASRPAVAMLFSLSQLIHTQTLDRHIAYSWQTKHGTNLSYTYLAGEMIQQPFMPVLDEDIIDGTLAAKHKALILTSIDYLDPAVIEGLKKFIAGGGVVLTTGDTTVDVPGAINLKITPEMPDQALIDKLTAEKNYKEMYSYMTLPNFEKGTRPFALAIQAALAKAGIAPIFHCDNPGIAADRQAAGDIEYLFAINTTPDLAHDGRILPATAAVELPGGALPTYDAITGGLVPQFKGGAKGSFRFGPAQMRVWARTARPIGSVRAGTPEVHRDYTDEANPLSVGIGASLMDTTGHILSGSAPLEIKLIDPLGGIRYDLYRATSDGVYRDTLPLALTDPTGDWTLVVRDLLANTSDSAHFKLDAVANAGALGGIAPRAAMFDEDRQNIYRFFRNHQDVTIVVGTSDYDTTQARRLADSLVPWDVRAKIVNAAEVNKARTITDDEARTWAGDLIPGAVKAGDGNPITAVGFAVQGPVVLIGSPTDNPLILFCQKNGFLPYTPKVDDFPGRGRGMVAWQREAIGRLQESIALIGYDEAGVSEAVGSCYEALAGLAPLTAVDETVRGSLSAVTIEPGPPAAPIAWSVTLPDRAVSISSDGGKLVVSTVDGSATTLRADGSIAKQASLAVQSDFIYSDPPVPGAPVVAPAPAYTLPMALAKSTWENHRVKRVASGGVGTLIGYWGGGVQIFDAAGTLKYQQTLAQDITDVAWLGDMGVIGLADGQVLALNCKP